VNRLNLKINEGEVFGFLGPNGGRQDDDAHHAAGPERAHFGKSLGVRF